MLGMAVSIRGLGWNCSPPRRNPDIYFLKLPKYFGILSYDFLKLSDPQNLMLRDKG